MKTQKFHFGISAVVAAGLFLLMALAIPSSVLAQGQMVNTEDIFGENGEIIGDMIEFETNDEGKLDRLIAKTTSKPVELISDKLNATCNLLTYDVSANKLVATGNPVNIKNEGVRATCTNFTYYPKDGKAELTGNPIVWQKSDDREVGIRGDVIKIFQSEEGKQRVIVESNKNAARSRLTMKDLQEAISGKEKDKPLPGAAQVEMTTKQAPKKEKKASAPAEAVKVDASSLDKIPEPAIEE